MQRNTKRFSVILNDFTGIWEDCEMAYRPKASGATELKKVVPRIASGEWGKISQGHFNISMVKSLKAISISQSAVVSHMFEQ